jgi:acyl-coenzyme A thioesterase PaaI-like protein
VTDATTERLPYAQAAPDLLEQLAQSVHRLTARMLVVAVGEPGLDEDLQHAVREVDRLVERLERHARGTELALGDVASSQARPYYVRGALVGPHHPMAPPLEIETRDGVTRGTATLDVVWEGPPGCVHGGYVAYLYDCIMGHHNVVTGLPGMTGTLQVRYRRPTPLYRELHFEARTVRQSGRKIVTEAWIKDGERSLSEASGLFILPKDFLANLDRD